MRLSLCYVQQLRNTKLVQSKQSAFYFRYFDIYASLRIVYAIPYVCALIRRSMYIRHYADLHIVRTPVVHYISYAQVTTKQQQEQLAAAGHASKKPVYVAVHVTCGFDRAMRSVYVFVVLFPAIVRRRIIRTRNDGPTQAAGQLYFKSSCPTAGAVHRVYILESSTQPTAAVYHSSHPRFANVFALVTSMAILCVVYGYSQSAPQCSCM